MRANLYPKIFEQLVDALISRLDVGSTIKAEDIASFLKTPLEDRDYECDLDSEWPLWYRIEKLVEIEPVLIEGVLFNEGSFTALEQLGSVFQNLKRVCFFQCEFHLSSLPDLHADLEFKSSAFLSDFEVPPEFSSAVPALFVDCEFNGKVKLLGEDRDGIDWGVFTSTIFKNCQLKDLFIEKTCLEARLFENDSGHLVALDSLLIRDCIFDVEMNFSEFNVNVLQITNAKFKRKLTLRSGSFQSLTAESSQFKSMVDCEGACFGRMIIERCRFFDVLSLESAKYACVVSYSEADAESCVSFRFCTFDKMINFRNVSFGIPLDLRHTNRKELPNFIGSYFARPARKTTDRETFRIIKHSFEAVGNQVEANEYFAMEMEAYRKELKGRPERLSERFLLACNGLMSGHGQSYIRPVFLIVLLMFVFQFVRYGYEQNWLSQLCPQAEPYMQVANGWARSLIVFQPFMKTEGLELVSLLFGVIFSILIWQTLSAIRRHTRK